jgi:hypothetical protein
MIRTITDILPGAVKVEDGIWKYKDWRICLPCGYVKNETTGEKKRFSNNRWDCSCFEIN